MASLTLGASSGVPAQTPRTQPALLWSLAACLSGCRATARALGLLPTLQGREEGTHMGYRMGQGGKGAGGAGGALGSGHGREPRAGLTESPSASR